MQQWVSKETRRNPGLRIIKPDLRGILRGESKLGSICRNVILLWKKIRKNGTKSTLSFYAENGLGEN